ncbi:hypothetical protein [Natronorubrum sp. FCH18a]|uniref:hypothetical protein n=1 Tax=Natronorubrum sp. FCH18a TaxID=3447018 RepID=UPI003F5150A4
MDTRDRSTEANETAEHADTADRDDETRSRSGDSEGERRNEPEAERRNEPEAERRNEPGGASVVDLARQPVVRAWTTYLTLLLALVAVGFGLFGIFSDGIDEGVVDTADDAVSFDAAFEAALSVPITATPYLAILLAAFVGAFLGWRLEHDRSTTYVTAGICTGVSTLVFWTLAALFGTIPLAVSIDIGGLLANAILAGITAGLVAAGGVWATRTRAPVTLAVAGTSRVAVREETREPRTDRETADTREPSDTRGTGDAREPGDARDTRGDPDSRSTRDARNER